MVEHLVAAKEKGDKEVRGTCKADLEEVNKSDNKQSEGYLSTASYGGVQSSLTCLYCMIGKKMGREFKK